MKERLNLVGLTGRAGSGKDTVAALLRLRGWERYAFADGVRSEISEYDKPPFELSQLAFTAFMGLKAGRLNFARPYVPAVRVLQQEWGAARRRQDEQYWIKALMKRAERETRPIIISDCRYPNEATWLEEMSGELWKIEGRREDGVVQHESETLVDTLTPDHVLDNGGTLEELVVQLLGLLEEDDREG